MTGVNTLFNGLLNTPGFDQLDFSALKLVVGSGLTVQKSVADCWQQVTGCYITEAYGLTEASPAVSSNPLGTPWNGIIGMPFPSTDMSIRDEGFNELPVWTGEGEIEKQIGEICIHGPQLMKGFWNNPAEIAKVMQDGWLKTGDVGYLNANGHLNLTDHKKDVILVSGFTVYPNEIESVIATHPGVLECGAIGVPDDKSGEAVKVVIVRRDPSLTKEAVIRHCKTQLTHYKLPRYVEFLDMHPMRGNMKALQFNVNVPKFIAAKSLRTIFGNRIFYGGPLKTVRLAEVSEPDLPSPDWVRVRTCHCGFCGSDLNLILLNDSPTASPFTSFPCVMGHEIVGELIETGAGVHGFAPGDRVVLNPVLGCEARDIAPICPNCRSGRSSNCENFAEGMLPPGMFTGINRGVPGGFAPRIVAHKSQLFRVPEGLSLKAAVMTEPVAVALQTVFDNLPVRNEKILVIGCGVIGNLIVQSLRVLAPETQISVIELSAFAARLAVEMGADEIIPATDSFVYAAWITGARLYKPMIGKEISMGGFTRIYDTVGSGATLNLSLRLLAARGTLSVVGIGGNAKLDLTPLWLKLQTVKGVYAYGRVTYDGKECHVFDVSLELMQKNKIEAARLVTHQFRLEDYRQMIEVNLNKEKHAAVKTVVSFDWE